MPSERARSDAPKTNPSAKPIRGLIPVPCSGIACGREHFSTKLGQVHYAYKNDPRDIPGMVEALRIRREEIPSDSVEKGNGSAWGTKKEGSDEWATPSDLYGAYDWEFAFTLDACASEKNAKHPNFEAKDGLTRPWERERVWCNPPYSDIEPWIRRGFNREADVAVFLLPVRQDTDWWRRYVQQGKTMFCDDYRVFRRRVRFVGATSSPAWATALVIYRRVG
jgi:phage N-6-adenine-methyltransferase